MSIVLVTHDIRVAEEHAHEVVVMYSGRIAETGQISDVVRRPMMPYTRALMAAVPSFQVPPRSLLPTIPGRPPHPSQRPVGCAFAPRCPLAEARCAEAIPAVSSRPGGDGVPQRWRCFVTGEQEGERA
jgi:oligopeptide/dipeptide ABC transporter ATP-binding protein